MSETEDQRETRKHNTKVRNDMIRKAHKELLPLEAQKAEIQESIREKRQSLKADLDMTLGQFDAARKLIMMEDKDKSRAQDDFREVYNALSTGDQLDWVVATQQEPAAA